MEKLTSEISSYGWFKCTGLLFSEYSEIRVSPIFKVEYFVKIGFDQQYPEGSSMRKEVEEQVENDYVNHLRNYCFHERIESRKSFAFLKNLILAGSMCNSFEVILLFLFTCCLDRKLQRDLNGRFSDSCCRFTSCLPLALAASRCSFLMLNVREAMNAVFYNL